MTCRNRASISLHNFFKVLLLLATTLFVDTTFAAGGEAVLLRKTYSGNIDYVAAGASFRNAPNPTNCSFFNPMSSTVSVNIPVGASILDAYLYFAGSADIGPNYHSSQIDIADQTGLTLNGVSISTTAGFNDTNFVNLTGLGNGNVDFFGARRDVSDIVTGAGAYTLAGMVVHLESQGRPTTGTCLGAWSLVVIYEDSSISKIRVINLFDGFQAFKNQTFDLQPRNFVVDSVTPTGKMTHMTYEGDESITSGNETFQLQIGSSAFTTKTNGYNPANNQYNSTVTGPDVLDSNSSYGFDLDTYDISSDLVGQADEFEATTRYNSGNDLVLLMAEVISVDNKALADIELTLSDVGLFNRNTTNAAQYTISVQNNGDGTSAPLTGFATGFIHVYDDLPSGISIDTLADITAPGWDCSATVVANDQIRCTYNLSTLGGGQLDRNTALPAISITVDVDIAAPTSVTNIAYASLCSNSPDTCTTFDGKHTDAAQFDPLNYYDDLAPYLFSVLSKSATNNNVDNEITPIITGVPSDLSTSTKTVVDLNGGLLDPNDTLEYTITFNETANIAATPVSISDLMDNEVDSFAYQSSTCAGASNSFAADTLAVTGMTVPANGSCNVVFRVDVKGTASAGTPIDNSATISNGNGAGGTVVAPTLLVAGVATGSKVLYLDGIGTTNMLTRTPTASDSSASINDPGTLTLALTPALVASLDINSGIIPVSVWVEAGTAGDYDITAELRYDSGGANTLIGNDSINNITMAAGVGNAQLFPFQITLGADITDLDATEDITLILSNGGGSPGNAIFHSLLSGIESNVVVDAATVINVNSVIFYDDVGRTNVVTTLEAGQTVYIEAVISDPFGSFDITGAKLTLIDPNLANQLTAIAMTEVGTGSGGTKTYAYPYVIPSASSISPGIWIAQITGLEGTEGTVTHTEVNSFTTTAPTVEVAYTVSPMIASASGTLTYTITITNGGVTPATGLFISQSIPVGTQNITVTSLGSGTDISAGGTIDISNITVPASSSIVIEYTVTVLGGALPGDLIDHIISVDNLGTVLTDIAPSVLIDPFVAPAGNKLLYGDNLSGSPLLDRTEPVSDTTLSIPSQGGSATLNLSPVLQSDLTLLAGNIEASIWLSRGASFAGERTIQATLAYTGTSSGTIDSDTVTITLQDGVAGAQYMPFTFTLASDLTILANSSLTLTVQNNTVVFGETLTMHTYKDTTNPTRVALNADTPLTVVALEFFDDSVDSGGVAIGTGGPGDTIWVRATVDDPFGAADITAAAVTITDPLAAVTVSSVVMTVPSTQPASGAQKYFEYQYTLTAELGDWDVAVIAKEGSEETVTASSNVAFNVNNNNPVLTDSYKTVLNTTTGDNSDTGPGDTLHYTIELIESGGSAASSVDVSDVIPVNTTFSSGSLTIDSVVQTDPAPNIALTGLTVPALGTMTIEFDVTVNGGVGTGTLISNSADITNPSGIVTNITVDAEDIVIVGPPASGTKTIYLDDLNTAPILTRSQPQTTGTTDSVVLVSGGASLDIDLTPALAGDITLDPVDGDIPIQLRMSPVAGFGFPNVTAILGYHNGGSVTSIGSFTLNPFMGGGVASYNFTIPLLAITTIPAGNQLRLTLSVTGGGFWDTDVQIYSFDSAGNRSIIDIVPTPVINVDSITFWTDTMGAGTEITNPDPNGVDVDIYAKIVISDPFGDADIQAPDAGTNPTTVLITDPDANAVLNASTSCTGPCYAYDGEDTVNDPPGDATRTFYYIVRIDSDPPATRGTWTVQVTANEGLETGLISHVSADSFTTLSQANLSTSTKAFIPFAGDLDPGETLSYVITLNNTGGQDADNVIFSDTLQSSPVSLTFTSGSTTCTDESAGALPNPTGGGGVVTLSNISVPAGGSCTITIDVVVGAGSPGDFIDNSAVITNPTGPGATPLAATVLLSESQIPVAGSKQLYLDGIGGASTLGRVIPASTSQTTLAAGGGTTTLVYSTGTTREMILQPGLIDVNLLLSSTGGFGGTAVEVELFIDANDGGGLTSIDSVQINLGLTGTAAIYTFGLGNPSALTLLPGTTFQLVITNNANAGWGATVTVYQATSAPHSEVVIPVTGSIEVTEIKFYDLSGDDDPGCTPTCGTEVNPAIVESGNTLWGRAIISDAFGASDVNTGCDGVTATNCPTIVITDPMSGDQTPANPLDELNFLTEPDSSSRQYEILINPAGFGLEGVWQIQIIGTEGTEDIITDDSLATFERFGPPNLLVVKTVTGTATPGLVMTYKNDINNTGTGPATTVILNNELGDFLDLELVESGGNWTAVFSLSGYTINVEEFDNGNDLYDYDPTGFCGAAIPSNSPCYDPAIKKWRIELNETIPAGASLIEEYRAMIEL